MAGAFDPDGPWRWGFTAERVSDKTLFDRYDVRDAYQDNGLYYGDSRRLISQIYAERQTQRSYLSVAAFTMQSLRVAQFDPVTPALNVFEDDNTLPLVAPLIEARWEPEGPVFGGRLRLRGSAVALTRDAAWQCRSDHEIGTLEAGKQADLIAVSLENIAQMPVTDVYSALLFASNAGDVFLTIAAGEELYRNGEAQKIDEKELKTKMRRIARKMA